MVDAKIIHEDGSEEPVEPEGPQPVYGYGAGKTKHIIQDPTMGAASVGLCGAFAGWTAAFVASYGQDPQARPVCKKCQAKWDDANPA